MTGWDLVRAVEGSIGYFWNVTRSQVYRELRALEAAGLARTGKPGPRDRRPFTITRTGRAAFREWMAREPAPELIRFPLLLSVFFGEHLEQGVLTGFLASHRGAHETRLEKYRALLSVLEDGEPFQAATLRFGIAYEEAVLRWFASLPWRGPGK